MKPIAFWVGAFISLQAAGVASASQGPGVSPGTASAGLQHMMAVVILGFPMLLAGVALAKAACRRRETRGL